MNTAAIQRSNSLSDETKKFIAEKLRKKHWLYNSLVLVISIVSIVIGLGIGLALFFKSQNDETSQIYSALVNLASLKTLNLQRAFTITVREVYMLQAQVAVSGPNMTWAQFERFIQSSKLLSNGGATYYGLEWIPQISVDNLQQFIQNARTSPPSQYSNFWVTQIDKNGNFGNVTRDRAYYNPIYYVLPLDDSVMPIVGLDMTSEKDSPRYNSVVKVQTTKDVIVSGKILLAEAKTAIPAVYILAPVFADISKNIFIGSVMGLFRIDTLIDGAIGKDSLIAAVYDSNATLLGDSFIHNTFENSPTVDSSITRFATVPMYTNITLPFADRIYTIMFGATDEFVAARRRPEKWIGLFVPIGMSFVILIIASFLVKRLQIRSELSFLMKDRVVLLEKNEQQLKALLIRISVEEHKTKTITNSITDFILLADCTGLILYSNAALRRRLQYTDEELSRMLAQEIIKDCDKLEVEATNSHLQDRTVLTVLKTEIEVKMTITPCQIWDQRNELVSGYVIVMRDLSDQKELVAQLHAGNEKIEGLQLLLDYEAVMQNPERRDIFVRYCREQFAGENVEFLEQVAKYKRTLDMQKRANLQGQIFTTFIKVGAEKQINIDEGLRKREVYNIEKGLAQLDEFDKLEAVVKTSVIQEQFKRFCELQTNTNESIVAKK